MERARQGNERILETSQQLFEAQEKAGPLSPPPPLPGGAMLRRDRT